MNQPSACWVQKAFGKSPDSAQNSTRFKFAPDGGRRGEFGSGQVVYGTDTPYKWLSNVDLVLKAPFLKDSEKEAILSGNLMKLLKIS